MTSTVHKLTKETIKAKTCIGLLHRGPYSEIGDTFKKFFATLNSKSDGSCGASTMDGKVLGLYLDEPKTTAPENLRSYAAMEIGDDAFVTKELPADWEKIDAPGGTAAVLTVTGSYSELDKAWQAFEQRIKDAGWKISTNPKAFAQEVYVTMDCKDDSKNVTQLVLFLEE